MMYGASQLARSALAPPRPPPPPRPTWLAAPCVPCGGPPSSPGTCAPAFRGRMLFDRPVRTSWRVMFPSCDVAYTMLGSSGSLRVWNPSPPPTMNQSLDLMPHPFIVREGPQCDQLSCAPPHTR